MKRESTDARPDPVAAAIQVARVRLPAGRHLAVEAYLRAYYAGADAEDLGERGGEDLCGAALSQLALGRTRVARTARVRVFSPRLDEHGWASPHTVVEIVNDDMPFLVDSTTMAVNARGYALHWLNHPILEVERDAQGHWSGLGGAGASVRESWIHMEIDRLGDAAACAALAADIERVLADVRAAVEDWAAMRTRAREIVDALRQSAPPVPEAERDEAVAFLEWLVANHFTFLGVRSYDLVEAGGADELRAVEGSGLGILRGSGQARSESFAALPAALRAQAHERALLSVTKSMSRATVHRPGYLDSISVRRFDAAGEVCGECRLLGLFTSSAYMTPPEQVPLLRHKVAAVLRHAGLRAESHDGKALGNLLATYPRDELFQSSVDELLRATTGIVRLGERQRTRLFVRVDPWERFVACLIHCPRERYAAELRVRWQAILTEAFNAQSSEFQVSISESMLARVLITVRTTPGAVPAWDERALGRRLVDAARRWEDDLAVALVEHCGESRGVALGHVYGAAFPAGYREDFSARAAVPDIELVDTLTPGQPIGMSLYRPLDAAPGALRFKLFRLGQPMALSDALPMLENMGLRVLDERPYRLRPADRDEIWLHDFGLVTLDGADVEIERVNEIFEDAFARVCRGEIEDDRLNRLVLGAGLPAEKVVVLRAYARYLRQIGFPLSQAFVDDTLGRHPATARLLVELFEARLDPAGHDDARAAQKAAAIESALEAVDDLSEDRVLRQVLALVLATLRTNCWAPPRAGRARAQLAFKFDPAQIPGLPAPRPAFEIFVYAPRFEGVHLRGGPVARGGLRWSDRREDFRTEILGLVKAQMVKNTVIVPVGSKGGFVLKRAPSPADREALLAEGVACYQDYLRGLLDLTDNRVGTRIEPAPGVHRRDGDDPYLVVAADKGTATFSDHANAVAQAYGFWLDDAFASGGSAGYDHKKMGITARGAWESVKRHFRELGLDTQTQPFTVVGIGDMSGDVFGNGMLLSRQIRLVAAFDHRHVFIDPDPDPERSWAERARLFALPRSSWDDYDRATLSPGGGIYARSAKSVAPTDEARRALGIEARRLTPAELISAILRAPVDLVYNGGIGTYVKAADETHADAGDRTNDAVRVNGGELRCRVVGEGGNLGFTQRGRIEYALAGGRINTDAIDNSAGVATSDQEVNIKILLGLAMADGELTRRQRDALLAGMTDAVAQRVLQDNYFQTQSLSIARRMGVRLLDAQGRFVRALEKAGRLDRALETLPADDEFEARRARRQGLVGPELAVMLAYAKLWLNDTLLGTSLPDDPWVARLLEAYFPEPLRARFAPWLPRHPLRREIVVTVLVNAMVNRVGSTFVHSLMEATGAPVDAVVRAWLLQREIFGYASLWADIEALDNRVADDVQADMLMETGRLAVSATTWLLRSPGLADALEPTIEHYRRGVAALEAAVPGLLDAPARAALEERELVLVGKGVPGPLAARVARFDLLYAALDLIDIAGQCGRSVETAAGVYFALAALLDLRWLRDRIGRLAADGHWQTLARSAMRDDLATLQRALTAQVLAQEDGEAGPEALIERWTAGRGAALARVRQVLDELRAVKAPDFAMLAVAMRELRHLV